MQVNADTVFGTFPERSYACKGLLITQKVEVRQHRARFKEEFKKTFNWSLRVIMTGKYTSCFHFKARKHDLTRHRKRTDGKARLTQLMAYDSCIGWYIFRQEN